MPSFSASLPKDVLSKVSCQNKFVQLVSSGEIEREKFNTWLAQEYSFVNAYVRLLAHALVHAPVKDYKVLIKGLSTLQDELGWFKSKLEEQKICVNNIKPLAANLAYQNWLNKLIERNMSYLSLMTCIYGIELCYYAAWNSIKNRDYQEFIDRWTSEIFGEYIEELRFTVDVASIAASDDDKREAIQLWENIVRLEEDFWHMTINE